MAIATMTLDTNSREVILVVDGVPIPTDDAAMSKYKDWEGKTQCDFRYMQRVTNDKGMDEMHMYFLPPPMMPTEDEDSHGARENPVDARGLAMKIVDVTTKLARDIASFLQARK